MHSSTGASEQIAAQIRVWLEQQQLQTGERIGTEQELADEFGVSRPTMREALRLLSAAHLIRVGRGRTGGIFVARTPSEGMSRNLSESIALMLAAQTISMAELLDARLSLEVPIAGRAAVNADEAVVARLEEAIEAASGHRAGHRAVQHGRHPLPPDPRRGLGQRPPACAHRLDPRGAPADACRHDLAPASTPRRSSPSTGRSCAPCGGASAWRRSARCRPTSSTSSRSSTRASDARRRSLRAAAGGDRQRPAAAQRAPRRGRPYRVARRRALGRADRVRPARPGGADRAHAQPRRARAG